MVKETAGQEEFLLTTSNMINFEHYISYSYSNSAAYNYFLWTLLFPYSCRSQVKAQPWSGNISHARSRSCVRRYYPFEVMEIVSYSTKSGRMTRRFV